MAKPPSAWYVAPRSINESGMIEKARPKVKPDTNAAEILEYLEK